MAMNIDWGTALCGAVVGWIVSGKVDEAQAKFSQTIASGSAEGVKAAWKKAAKQAKAKAGAKTGNGNGNGKNG